MLRPARLISSLGGYRSGKVKTLNPRLQFSAPQYSLSGVPSQIIYIKTRFIEGSLLQYEEYGDMSTMRLNKELHKVL